MRLVLPRLILVVLLIVAAWPTAQIGRRADLNVAYVSIETLDPQRMRASEDIRCAYALFEGLCTFDPATFTIQPGVAERWEVSDDGLTYTFYLRDNARWSNGDAVTAHDFVAAWRQGMMPDISPHYIDFLFYIKGGRAYFDWCRAELERINKITDQAQRLTAARRRIEQAAVQFEQTVGVGTPDPQTVIVQLERPTPFFLEIAACWPLFPLHQPTMDAVCDLNLDTLMLRRDPQWTKPDRLIGNGPYRLAAWRFKQDIRFEANPHYWNRDVVGPQSVRLTNYKDHNTAFLAYQTGALDILFGTPVGYRDELVKAGREGSRTDIHEVDAYGTYYYAFNCRPKLSDGRANPFADARVRRAFTMAIDKHELVANVTRIHQTVAGAFIPPSAIAGYQSPAGLDYDPQAARRQLADAGYPDFSGFMPIVISYNTGGGHEDVAHAVGAMWTEHFGVSVSYEAQEWKVYLNKRNTGDFMIARSGWFGDYVDPTTFLDLFVSTNGNNDTGFNDPAFDELMRRAAESLDPAARYRLLEQAEAYLVDQQLPLAPLFHYKLIHVFDPDRLHNVSLHPRNMHMYHLIRVPQR